MLLNMPSVKKKNLKSDKQLHLLCAGLNAEGIIGQQHH
jgi:hypothetical protein